MTRLDDRLSKLSVLRYMNISMYVANLAVRIVINDYFR